MNDQEFKNEQMDETLDNEQENENLEMDDSDFVELTDEMMEEISGGAKSMIDQPWILNPRDVWHYKGNFQPFTVCNVKYLGEGSALTLRREPIDQEYTIIHGYYWQNGNTIYVNTKIKVKAGWKFCYHHKKGAYGYVKSNYIC